MNEKRLFRAEVSEKIKNQNYGSVSINTPVKYITLTCGISAFVMCFFMFVILGEFTEKFIVKGYLESTKGVARIYANQNGVVAKSFCKQGEQVKKGDKLFLISLSNAHIETNSDRILLQFDKRKKRLEQHIAYKQQQLATLKQLLQKKYIPSSVFNEKQDELMSLQHQKNDTIIDIIRYKNSQSYVIHSPIDGIIANVLYQEGQYTQLSKPLLKILPNPTSFIAQLYIPVKQAGFIQSKSKVMIHYDTYPYARFGASNANILEISKSILTDAEEEKPMRIGEPYYKATALLDKQFITINGVEKKLQHGMTLSAVIMGSKRKIWQWILSPLYSFSGVILS